MSFNACAISSGSSVATIDPGPITVFSRTKESHHSVPIPGAHQTFYSARGSTKRPIIHSIYSYCLIMERISGAEHSEILTVNIRCVTTYASPYR